MTGAAFAARVVVPADWRHHAHSASHVWVAGHPAVRPCGPPATEAELGALLGAVPDARAALKAVASLSGCFAVVVLTPGWGIAAVDRVRTRPILWSEQADGVLLGTEAPALLALLGDRAGVPDVVAATALAMSGYSIGRRTLRTGVHALRAGEALLLAPGRTPETTAWYRYKPWRGAEVDAGPQDLERSLAEATRRAFESLAASAAGRPILVPLSGGLDSRLVACGLAEVGYRDVRCVAYGLPGNHEAAASREVARRLGLPWEFVPVDHRVMRRHYRSERHADYLRRADSLTAVPVEHEYAALAELEAAGALTDHPIVVNGQTGDFLSGGHLPAALLRPERAATSEARRGDVVGAVFAKHYGLWSTLQTPERLALLAPAIEAELDDLGGLPSVPAGDAGLAEAFEWRHRQALYVVTNQRVYEFFGLDWRLPLWDGGWMDFWESVPPALKQGQRLYRGMLSAMDWGGVWRDLPVREWVSPRWARVARPLLKAAFAPAGHARWHRAERRLLDYWTDVQGKSAVVPYSHVLFDRRGWRHAVSSLAERYLESHGFDWTGTPSRSGA